jgi:thioredoxin reductase
MGSNFRRNAVAVAGSLAIIVLAVLLGRPHEYSPGPLLKDHQKFGHDCATCHGTVMRNRIDDINRACVECHVDTAQVSKARGALGLADNPHTAVKLSDATRGLKPAVHLAQSADGLMCVSCHSEHQGAAADQKLVAARNCQGCHYHDSIANENIPEHRFARIRFTAISRVFVNSFSHQNHLEEISKLLVSAKDKAAKVSKKNKPAAQQKVDALRSALDPAGQHLHCETCHEISPAKGEQPAQNSFPIYPTTGNSFPSTGCHTAGCHAADSEILATLPNFKVTNDHVESAQTQPFQNLNARFAHWQVHLRSASLGTASVGSACIDCHVDIEKNQPPPDNCKPAAVCGQASLPAPAPNVSPIKDILLLRKGRNSNRRREPANLQSTTPVAPKSPAEICGEAVAKTCPDPTDNPIQEVEPCFACHAHQPRRETQSASSMDIVRVANAAEMPDEKQIVQCGECHRFHFYYGSPAKTLPLKFDFERPARTSRPNSPQLRGVWWGSVVAMLFGSSAVFLFVGWATMPPPEHLRPRPPSELPRHKDNYETNVEGLYVVGEVAGVPSINSAMRSGREAVEAILKNLGSKATAPRPTENDPYQVIVVGCGPAGLGAATLAAYNRLKYLVLEKDRAAATIYAYPEGKEVHANPLQITEYEVDFVLEGDEIRERLIAEWDRIIKKTELMIHENEKVENVSKVGNLFEVSTTAITKSATRESKTYRAQTVVLAIGQRCSPRRIPLKGIDDSRILNNLGVERYERTDILVYGGGNAGHEVAIALADASLQNNITFAYRDLKGVTGRNRDRVTALKGPRFTELANVELREVQDGSAILVKRPPKHTLSYFEWTVSMWKSILAAILAPLRIKPAPATPAASAPEVIKAPATVIFEMLGTDPPKEFLMKMGIEMMIRGRQ